MWKKGASGQDDYHALVKKAERLQEEVRTLENKSLLFDKLSELYGFDPRKIKKDTLVADASAAIQSAAQQGGIQLGPFRESPARSSGRDLTTIQVEGSGAVPAAPEKFGVDVFTVPPAAGDSNVTTGGVVSSASIVHVKLDAFPVFPAWSVALTWNV